MESNADCSVASRKLHGFWYKLAMPVIGTVKRIPMIYTLVLLPWMVWSSYLVFFKTPTYESTAIFLVNQHQYSNKETLLKTLFAQKKPAKTGVDVNITVLQDFIHSPAMFEHLQKQLNLIDYYQSLKIDTLSRLKRHPNQYEVLKYVQSKLNTSVGATNELSVSVIAFSPEQAQTIMREVVKSTEDFFKQATNANYVEQSHRIDERLQIAKEKYLQAKWEKLHFQKNTQKSDRATTKESLSKEMAVEFARTEYKDAQEAYVLWHMKTSKNSLVTMTEPTFSSYAHSPLIPQDLIRLLVVLLLLYGIGKLLLTVVNEHTE